MGNIHKVREMLAQIGGACVQVTVGCEECQHRPVDVAMLQELEHALGELHKNAQQLVATAGELDDDLSCPEDDASCDCSWHENLRHALASGGGVTR